MFILCLRVQIYSEENQNRFRLGSPMKRLKQKIALKATQSCGSYDATQIYKQIGRYMSRS